MSERPVLYLEILSYSRNNTIIISLIQKRRKSGRRGRPFAPPTSEIQGSDLSKESKNEIKNYLRGHINKVVRCVVVFQKKRRIMTNLASSLSLSPLGQPNNFFNSTEITTMMILLNG